jgi:hypothetical protein
MRDWKWWAGAALLGAGAVAVACSSSSSNPSDGGTPEAGVDTGAESVDTGAPSDGGGDGDAAMATCEASTMNSATIMSGPAWTCLEMVCKTSLTACAADCECNNAVLTALECVVTAGGSGATPAQTAACFTSNLGPLINGPQGSIVMPVATCLMTMSQGCAEQGMEGGTDGGSDGGDSATASDATGEASDSATASDATGQ